MTDDDRRPDEPSRPSPGWWRPPAHRICQLDSCQPDGGSELRSALEARLGIATNERTADGSISLEGLDCIGLCDIRQATTVDDMPVIGLESALRALDELLEAAAREDRDSGQDR
jgi:formate dehydrogenase subunit gamma